MERVTMDLTYASPRLPMWPHNMLWVGSLRPVPVLLPHISKMSHYIDNIMLTCEDLPLLLDTLQDLLKHLWGRSWVVNPQKFPQKKGQGTPTKYLGVIWSGKTYILPETVTDKMQAYPTPKNVKEMQAYVEILGLEDFYSSPGRVLPSLIPPG